MLFVCWFAFVPVCLSICHEIVCLLVWTVDRSVGVYLFDLGDSK